MRSQLIFLGKLLGFWLLFYFFQRLLFVFHFFTAFDTYYSELFSVPFHALQLDLSAFGYTMSIAFLLSVVSFFIRSDKGMRLLNKIIRIYVVFFVVLGALIMAGEITTYIEWKTKLSSKIYLHLANPSEVFRTAPWSYTLWFFTYFFAQLGFMYVVYFKWMKRNEIEQPPAPNTLKKQIGLGLTYLLSMAFVLVLFIRGGLQQIPVSSTNAYFSNKQMINDVAVNPEWNFLQMTYAHLRFDLSAYYTNLNPVEREKLTEELYAANPTADTVRVLNTKRPNIILVTLEGWSAQLIEPLGGKAGITPNFNTAAAEGLLFTEIYSSGGTSETGHSAIISGYQTLSGISITTQPAKCRKLPSINQSLAAEGYSSFYTFGGALSYGNIGGYLADVGFDRVVDEDELDLEPTGKLGTHDEAMFPYFLSEIKKATAPYFYGLFTQSTHAPYDMPAEPYPDYDGDPYITSMHYADKHLGNFLAEIKKLPDYDNTLVVMIADHGRINLFNGDTYDEDYFHIPLLFWGGALKKEYSNQQITKIGSQSDLAATLLNQLNLPTKAYKWSKNLLNPTTKEWAICTSTLSYGWKNKDGYTVYHMIDDQLIYSAYSNPHQTDSVLHQCKSVLETIYEEYEGF